MKPSVTYIPAFCFLVMSCFPDDKQVMPFPGNVTTIEDSIQVNTSYFDLESDRVVSAHRNDTWQLGFECGMDGWHIITNSGSSWFIYNTEQLSLETTENMPEHLDHLYDVQAGFPQLTAVGNWVNFSGSGDKVYSQKVYLMGKLSEGKFSRLIQLVFLHVDANAYKFYFREKNTGISDTVTVVKNDTVNYVYYSFDTYRQVNLEPPKTSYDLIFTSYYDLATLFGITIPYHVGGVLLNSWQTAGVLDSVNGYKGISYENLMQYTFTGQRDIPGYRWKSVSVDVSGSGTASYAVKSNYSYIIRTAQHNYFKLKFLSYALDGQSGFPQFEYSLLQ